MKHFDKLLEQIELKYVIKVNHIQSDTFDFVIKDYKYSKLHVGFDYEKYKLIELITKIHQARKY